MSKKRITYIHIFIWLFAIFANLPYATIGKNMPPEQIVTNIVAFLYLMVAFYLFYLVLVPYFLERKNLPGFFGFSIIIVAFMPFAGYSLLFLTRAIFDGTFHNFYRGYSLRMHMSGFYPVLTAAVFGSFFKMIVNWVSTMNQKAELDRQKVSAELELLKSKLNPHFLFNTLNNIDTLIQKDPARASEALIRLSEMMRYLTYETTSEFVHLEKDVAYIDNLIELYRIRIKSPEEIESDIQGDLKVSIAPALFMPLIENAFKFAQFGLNKPCIKLGLMSQNGIIEFEISNTIDAHSPASGNVNSGFGLINLRKRLELIYPGSYSLNIKPGENEYIVNLTIDTNGNKVYSN